MSGDVESALGHQLDGMRVRRLTRRRAESRRFDARAGRAVRQQSAHERLRHRAATHVARAQDEHAAGSFLGATVALGTEKTQRVGEELRHRGAQYSRWSDGHFYSDYTQFADPRGLEGARIGIARQFLPSTSETNAVFETAVQTLRDAGADVGDPVDIPTFDEFFADPSEIVVLV
jgi:hypothetical protein